MNYLKSDDAGVAVSGLRVVFLGVSSLLFDDGETAFMTDGFFTRPGLPLVIEPDRELIASFLQRLRVKSLAAVIALHSHYDHALDSPIVAEQTGAQLVGSTSTKNIGVGCGLGEDRIEVVTPGESMTFGRFNITFLLSRHSPRSRFPGDITKPVSLPAPVSHYQQGQCYSVLIEHDGRTILVHGSAGFIPGALKGRTSEVIYLAIGTLGKQDESYRYDYWREVVETVGARRVIAVHWDNFLTPLDTNLEPMPGDNYEIARDFILARGKETGVDVCIPLALVSTDPFDGL